MTKLETPTISIIIPNYNGLKYLNGCLASLTRQVPDTPPTEIVVVDNGSTDESIEQARALYPDVRYILLPENTGFCHAVNVGIRETQSPYVLLLNNDTVAAPDFVRELYRAITADSRTKRPVFAASALMRMWDRPELVDDAGDRFNALGWAYSRGKGCSAADYMCPTDIFSACAGAAIYRRDVLERIGLFDELHFAYLEDVDLGYRAQLYGYRSVYAPAAGVIHYGSASTGSRYNERKTALVPANNIYLIWKNMPLLQILWNLPLLLLGFLAKFTFFCSRKLGRLYLKGLGEGLRRCCTPEAREHKVPFRMRRLPCYLRIQGQLYANLFRFAWKK